MTTNQASYTTYDKGADKQNDTIRNPNPEENHCTEYIYTLLVIIILTIGPTIWTLLFFIRARTRSVVKNDEKENKKDSKWQYF